MNVQTRLMLATSSIVLAFAASGCRQSTTPGGNGNNGNNPPPAACPEGGLTICSLKLATAPDHPAVGDPIQLDGAVVTTSTFTVSKSMNVVTLAGFFVQDPQRTEDPRYSGILVVYNPTNVQGTLPQPGQTVSIEGTYDEHADAKQLRAARVTPGAAGPAIAPFAADRAEDLATGGRDAEALEGVLVKLEAVTITENKTQYEGQQSFGVLSSVTNQPILSAFRVDNSLIVASDIFYYRNPQMGEEFTQIAGVLKLGTAPFNAGETMLLPRGSGDVVPKNAAAVVTKIRDAQDPSSPGKPLESCRNVNGETIGKCAVADLKRVLVVASGGYVSSNLRSFFVVDPAEAAMNNGRYAGIKVVYGRTRLPYVPDIGHYVDVKGEIINYQGGMQIQYPEVARNGTDTGTFGPAVISNPADLARKNSNSHAYEGMLVQIQNVTVTERCVPDDRGVDHGNWMVTGEVMMGTAFDYAYKGGFRPSTVQCLDSERMSTGACSCDSMSIPMDLRTNGDSFASITGVLDFAYGDFQLQPRSDTDLVKN